MGNLNLKSMIERMIPIVSKHKYKLILILSSILIIFIAGNLLAQHYSDIKQEKKYFELLKSSFNKDDRVYAKIYVEEGLQLNKNKGIAEEFKNADSCLSEEWLKDKLNQLSANEINNLENGSYEMPIFQTDWIDKYCKFRLRGLIKYPQLIETANEHGKNRNIELALKDLKEAYSYQKDNLIKEAIERCESCSSDKWIIDKLDDLTHRELEKLQTGHFDTRMADLEWLDKYCKSRLWSVLSERSKKLKETVDSIITRYAKPYVILKEIREIDDALITIFIYSHSAKTGKERAATSMKAAIDAQKRMTQKPQLIEVLTEFSSSKIALDSDIGTHVGVTDYSPLAGVSIDSGSQQIKTWDVNMECSDQISYDIQTLMEAKRKILSINPSVFDTDTDLNMQKLGMLAIMEQTGFDFEYLKKVLVAYTLECEKEKYFEVDSSGKVIINSF